MLTKDFLLTPKPARTVANIFGWGEVHLRAMSAANIFKMTELHSIAEAEPSKALDPQLYAISVSVEDSKGNLIFSDEDRAALGALDIKTLNSCMEEISILNELDQPIDDDTEKKAEKN